MAALRRLLKQEKKQLFSEVLNGLDLHRPPCAALMANQVYYLIGALACDLMVADHAAGLERQLPGLAAEDADEGVPLSARPAEPALHSSRSKREPDSHGNDGDAGIGFFLVGHRGTPLVFVSQFLGDRCARVAQR